MSNWGFKVAKTGYDVNTATDEQLAATSARQSEVVVVEGSAIVNINGTSASTTINHNLGALHQAFVGALQPGTLAPLLLSSLDEPSGVLWSWYITTNTLVITVFTGSVQVGVYDFKYKILYNTL